MFIGHFAMGFGAKRFAPQVSLGILFLACQLADLIASDQGATRRSRSFE